MKLADFEILVASDPDYEDLIAEVYYQGHFLFAVTQEQGIEATKVSVRPQDDGPVVCLGLDLVMAALEAARTKLGDLRRND